jgi:predicted anti-sigma-YlaC factor YlaD
MGRRSRKRAGVAAPEPAPRPAPPRLPAARSRRARAERPKAPWHPFPLVELCVLVGIVLLVVGAFDLGSDRGRLLLVCGMALGSIGGLDTAVREHFAGFRSHTTVLSALPGVVTAAVLALAGAPWAAVVAGAALVFAVAFWALLRAYRRRR